MNNPDQINVDDWVILENNNFEDQGFKQGTVCIVFKKSENTGFIIVNDDGNDLCVERSDISKTEVTWIKSVSTYNPPVEPNTEKITDKNDTANVDQGPAIDQKLSQASSKK